jgi:predicted metal-dependent HD superfamily phosphohydrolase
MTVKTLLTDDARRARWCDTFGAHEDSIIVYNDLSTRMSGEGRHYHTMEHIDEMLTLADEAGLTSPVIDAAIWFHDAVYEAGSKHNEALSAELAEQFMPRMGLNATAQTTVTAMILASREHRSKNADIQPFLDLDMAILGAKPERYKRYAADVRQEFAPMSDWGFKLGRKHFLKGCLRRKQIYLTPWFTERFEAQARENIKAEIESF